jgi:hypothetical protein
VFEYEVTGDTLAITLLRCVGAISRDHLATRPFSAGPGVATPAAQMLGRTAFALALRSSDEPLALLRDWERFALPILEVPLTGTGRPAGRAETLLHIEGDAILSTIRRVGSATEVRGWNPFDDREVRWSVGDRSGALGPAEIATW